MCSQYHNLLTTRAQEFSNVIQLIIIYTYSYTYIYIYIYIYTCMLKIPYPQCKGARMFRCLRT